MLRKPKSLCHSRDKFGFTHWHSKRFTYGVIPPASRFLLLYGNQEYWIGVYFHDSISTQSPLPRSYLQISSHSRVPTRSQNLSISFIFAREHNSIHTHMMTDFFLQYSHVNVITCVTYFKLQPQACRKKSNKHRVFFHIYIMISLFILLSNDSLSRRIGVTVALGGCHRVQWNFDNSRLQVFLTLTSR